LLHFLFTSSRATIIGSWILLWKRRECILNWLSFTKFDSETSCNLRHT
jgi:hypothetical protein